MNLIVFLLSHFLFGTAENFFEKNEKRGLTLAGQVVIIIKLSARADSACIL